MVKVKRPAPPNRLRIVRLEHRRSQHEVAAYLGISQTRYWQIENSYTEPTEADRVKLAKLFALGVDDIFPKAVA